MVSAWVTLFVYFVMMVLSYGLGQHFYPIPYKTKKIVGFLAILTVFSVVIVKGFEMNFWLSNVLLIAYIAIIGYSERNLLKKVLVRKSV